MAATTAMRTTMVMRMTTTTTTTASMWTSTSTEELPSGAGACGTAPISWTRLSGHCFVIDWCPVAQRGVKSSPVVESLDELEDRSPCFGLRRVLREVHELPLQGREEGLSDCVVPTIACAGHAPL